MAITVTDPRPIERAEEILTAETLSFIEEHHTSFADTRSQLLAARGVKRHQIAETGKLDFLPVTRDVRDGDRTVAKAPPVLRKRRVEMTGGSWLARPSGNGASAIHNLMEEAATAEISRSQVWQQIRNKSVLADSGNTASRELVERILAEETGRLRAGVGDEAFARYYKPASELIADICLSGDYTDFLTIPAYELVG